MLFLFCFFPVVFHDSFPSFLIAMKDFARDAACPALIACLSDGHIQSREDIKGYRISLFRKLGNWSVLNSDGNRFVAFLPLQIDYRIIAITAEKRLQFSSAPDRGGGVMDLKGMINPPWSIGNEQEINIVKLCYARYMLPPAPKVRVIAKGEFRKTIPCYFGYLISLGTVDSDFSVSEKEQTMECRHDQAFLASSITDSIFALRSESEI